MVERVARAIMAEVDRQEALVDEGDAGLYVDGRLDFDKLARAAIEAMREPTREMIEAGNAAAEDKVDMDGWESTGFYPVVLPALASTVLAAMLNSALAPVVTGD